MNGPFHQSWAAWNRGEPGTSWNLFAEQVMSLRLDMLQDHSVGWCNDHVPDLPVLSQATVR